MRVVIQRVSEANVRIDGVTAGQIGKGLLILLGIEENDEEKDIQWLTDKVYQIRIFNDDANKMNLSIGESGGDIMVISQFTLYASTKKGNRPSFIKAAKTEIAIPLYERFINVLSQKTGKKIESGVFGADMKVSLINDGPVTIIIDSKTKE